MTTPTFDERERIVLETAVSVVRQTAIVEEFSRTLGRDRSELTLRILDVTQADSMSREEGLEQLMEWCVRELASLRAAPSQEPRPTPSR